MGAEPDPREVRDLGLDVFTDPEDRRAGGEGQPAERVDAGGPTMAEGRRARNEPVETMFVLSEALPVIPAKLVRRILRAEYVDMAELLKDNMEAERRRMQAEGGGTHPHFSGRQSRREVPDILSWLQCFGLYAAVVSSRFPEKTKELLAYQTLMITEARRCGGRGWALYDAAFRQQMVSFETTNFAKINQSLYATTFLAYGGPKRKFCPDCMMADHSQEECALNPNRVAPAPHALEGPGGGRVRAQDVNRRSRRERPGPCFAWNEERCTFVRCRYDHVCAICGGDHRKAQCKERRREHNSGAHGK